MNSTAGIHSLVPFSFRCVSILFAGLTNEIAFSQTNEIASEQKVAAIELLDDYAKNRAKLKQFSVAVRCLRKSVVSAKPDEASETTYWVLCFCDEENSKRRYDHIRSDDSAHYFRTALVKERSLTAKIHGTKIGSDTHLPRTIENDLVELAQPMLLIDPFNLPFANGGSFEWKEMHSFRHNESMLKDAKLASYTQNGNQVDVDFLLSQQHRVHKAIRFERHEQLMLPVESELYRILKDGRKSLMTVGKTTWGLSGQDSWLPKSLSLKNYLGDPVRSTTEYEVQLLWLPYNDFPSAILDLDADISPLTLREQLKKKAYSFWPADPK